VGEKGWAALGRAATGEEIAANPSKSGQQPETAVVKVENELQCGKAATSPDGSKAGRAMTGKRSQKRRAKQVLSSWGREKGALLVGEG
jgi:hypothetical protein